MKPVFKFLSIIAILASIALDRDHLLKVAAQSADETALRALAQQYVELYAKEDIVAMMSLWSMRSTDVRQVLERMLEGFNAVDRVFSNVNVSSVLIEGRRAVLVLSADLSVSTPSGDTSSERFSRNLALVKEVGRWKIWRDVPASQGLEEFLKKGGEWKTSTTLPLEEQFATALLELTTGDQTVLLSENSEMLTLDLRRALLKKAALFQSTGFSAKAIDAYRLTQKVAEIMGDKQGVALALLGLARINRDSESLSQAIEGYQQARILFEELGDRGQVGVTWREIGKTQLMRRDHTNALESYRKALAVFEALNDRPRVADALDEIGAIHYGQRRYSEALSVYEKSLRLNELLGRKAEVAIAFKNIGNARYYKEDYEGAIESYLKAVAGFELVKNASAISETIRYLGGASFTLGNYDSALEYYQKALIVDGEIEDIRGTAAALFGIGSVMYALGDFAAALEHYYRNLGFLELLGDKAALPDTLRRIGLAHLRLRNYNQALTEYQRCLSLYEERRDMPNAALLLVEIGNLQFLRSGHDAALENYSAALSRFESLNQMGGVAGCYGGIAAVYSARRQYDTALEFYEKSLPIFESLGDKEQAAGTLESIAGVHYARTDYAKALEFADRASTSARQARSQEVLWQARFTAGSAHRSLNRFEEARRAYSESIATIEAIRAHLTDDEQAQPFFRDKNHPYIALMELLLEQNDTLGAFSLAERVKTHSQWDMLRGVRLRITRGMSTQEQNNERQLSKRLVYLARQFQRDKQMTNPVVSLSRQLERSKDQQQQSETRLAALEARVDKARQEYASLAKRLYTAHPQLRALRGEAQPLKAEEAGRLLDAETALLSFVVTDARTCLFVLTRERSRARVPAPKVELKSYVTLVSRDDLAARVAGFRRLIEQRSSEAHKSARELFDLLMGGASPQLTGKTQLVIAPDSVLWDLPFQALQPSDGHYLVEDYAVGYAPSLTAFREVSKPLPPDRGRSRVLQLLAFGDPQISGETLSRVGRLSVGWTLVSQPAVEDQLRSLIQIYGVQQSRVYTGADATEEQVKTQSGRSRVLQLSAPAVLSDTNPLHSPVLMGLSTANRKEDGLLQPWEIAGLNLKSDIVVMSACEPASLAANGGEALMGLAGAWLATGSRAVVLNQGKAVADEAGFLPELHRNLRQAPPAEALRRSAMKMLRGQYADPAYWSGFIVFGKGK